MKASSSSPSTAGFSPEGGKLYLADALFVSFRYNIRCTHCAGNPGQPGFIRDQGGKAPADGLKRRQWACQRSNGRSVTDRCPRVSCDGYIRVAHDQLALNLFAATLAAVCLQYDTILEENMALRGYLTGKVTVPGTPTHSSFYASSASVSGLVSTPVAFHTSSSALAPASAPDPFYASSSRSSLAMPSPTGRGGAGSKSN